MGCGPWMEQLLKLLKFNPSTTVLVGSLVQISSVFFSVTSIFSSTSWIIDSGASDHMTNLLKLFQTYVPCPGNQKIRIANESFSSIARKGLVPIYEKITLRSVLHVLTCLQFLKILIVFTFFYSHCEFQDRSTGKMIGNARMQDGLYYFDEKGF